MDIKHRFEGCILGGAIGDAFGSVCENQVDMKKESTVFYPFGKPIPPKIPGWRITDDTQLTLATCEAIIESGQVYPEQIAQKFVEYYKARKITGIGASTLKSLQELAFGGHWSQVGRKGEFAAGNGAAMRIAPLAFTSSEINRKQIEEVSRITHHNDEAYAGALSVVISIQAIIHGRWTGKEDLLEIITESLPDTKVRDRLIEIGKLQKQTSIQAIGNQFGNSGYVVESVPLAILAASQVIQIGFEKMLEELVMLGGDTDTNCSIAGQIAGTLVGTDGIPESLLEKLRALSEYDWIESVIDKFTAKQNWKLKK